MLASINSQLSSVGGMAVLAVLVIAVWLLLSPRSLFVIRFREGTARVTRGKVASSFVSEVENILQRAGVSSATIRGDIHGANRDIKLRFSHAIPPPVRQQIRNAWQWG